jgi:hypothetical protein
MSYPDPTGFTTPGNIVGALASQVNFSVMIEALCSDRQRLSPAQAQRGVGHRRF